MKYLIILLSSVSAEEQITENVSASDYHQLCSKVEELKNRKQYMDKLLSYYNVSALCHSVKDDVIFFTVYTCICRIC